MMKRRTISLFAMLALVFAMSIVIAKPASAATYSVASSTTQRTIAGINKDGLTISGNTYSSTADKKPIQYGRGGNATYSTGKASNVIGLYASGRKNIKISGCTFKNISGMQLSGCSNVVIENCTFTGCENGIYLSKCSNVTIRNCTFTMNSTGLIQYYQAIYLADGNNVVNVSGCKATASNYIFTAFRSGSSRYAVANKAVTFTNCTADGKFRTAFQNIWGNVTFNSCQFSFTGSFDGTNTCIMESTVAATSTIVKSCTFTNKVSGKIVGGNNYKPKVGSKFTSCTFIGCGTQAQAGKYGTYTYCTFR